MKVKELFKDVQDVELTAEQEKQIKDYLGIKEPKVWKPEAGEIYYYVDSTGYMVADKCIEDFNGVIHYYDMHRINLGNCFKTKEEAEFAAEQLKVYTELKRYAAEHNEHEIDWSNSNSCKYNIRYAHEDRKLYIDYNAFIQIPLAVYFTSYKIAEDAIKAVGEDRIKKYLFGIME